MGLSLTAVGFAEFDFGLYRFKRDGTQQPTASSTTTHKFVLVISVNDAFTSANIGKKIRDWGEEESNGEKGMSDKNGWTAGGSSPAKIEIMLFPIIPSSL
ncbi:hypothetical protein X798_02362, partial [Onchocerca flexuosa]|uniref:Dirigent protein n=2 Tax=Onchocerca flexuosa TaxID=387005 RepID=A0A183HDU6_9BILA